MIDVQNKAIIGISELLQVEPIVVVELLKESNVQQSIRLQKENERKERNLRALKESNKRLQKELNRLQVQTEVKENIEGRLINKTSIKQAIASKKQEYREAIKELQTLYDSIDQGRIKRHTGITRKVIELLLSGSSKEQTFNEAVKLSAKFNFQEIRNINSRIKRAKKIIKKYTTKTESELITILKNNKIPGFIESDLPAIRKYLG